MLDFFANPGIIGQNNEDTVTAVYQAAKRSIASSGVLAPNDLQVYAVSHRFFSTRGEGGQLTKALSFSVSTTISNRIWKRSSC